MVPTGRSHLGLLLSLALTSAVLLVYWPVRSHGFVNLDDGQYVYENARVLSGLSLDGVGWAFASLEAANWHPLTWLSHMADVQLFGAGARGPHLVNLALHILDTLLLFWLLARSTAARWRSALTAALFGIHPLHVESVAWISERKDVLSTLLLFAALHAWVSYARRPRRGAYLAALASIGLGLLAKPMLVTAPALLLLLDFWPLDRPRAATLRRLLLEKVPFATLSLASCVITYLAQSAAGDHPALSELPLGERLANALASYAGYLGKALWPASLAAFYPHPHSLGRATSAAALATGAAVVVGLTALAWRTRRSHPYVAWGWLWYLASLVPVIGLVQAGSQAMADRYTYVPLVGPFAAAVWGLAALAAALPGRPWVAATVAAALLGALGARARSQVETWRDSFALHRHAVAATADNWKAWAGLGDAHLAEGRLGEAVAAYRESLRILPANPLPRNNLGIALARSGLPAEAAVQFRLALRYDPGLASAWYNLGTAQAAEGLAEEAAAAFREAIRIEPGRPEAWFNLARTYQRLGALAEAERALGEVVRLTPGDAAAWAALAVAQASRGDGAAALRSLRALQALDPGTALALARQLGVAGP